MFEYSRLRLWSPTFSETTFFRRKSVFFQFYHIGTWKLKTTHPVDHESNIINYNIIHIIISEGLPSTFHYDKYRNDKMLSSKMVSEKICYFRLGYTDLYLIYYTHSHTN